MDFRKTLSKPLKKLKDKLPGGHRRRDGRSGSENDGKGGGFDVKGSQVSKQNQYLQSEVDVGGTLKSGQSQEASDTNWKEAAPVGDTPTSTASIPQGWNSGGT